MNVFAIVNRCVCVCVHANATHVRTYVYTVGGLEEDCARALALAPVRESESESGIFIVLIWRD